MQYLVIADLDANLQIASLTINPVMRLEDKKWRRARLGPPFICITRMADSSLPNRPWLRLLLGTHPCYDTEADLVDHVAMLYGLPVVSSPLETSTISVLLGSRWGRIQPRG